MKDYKTICNAIITSLTKSSRVSTLRGQYKFVEIKLLNCSSILNKHELIHLAQLMEAGRVKASKLSGAEVKIRDVNGQEFTVPPSAIVDFQFGKLSSPKKRDIKPRK